MSMEDGRQLLQNEVLTVKEVANYLRVSRVTVWRWCQQGVIPASQVGRGWRIRRGDVLQLFDPSDQPELDEPYPAEPLDSP